MNINKKYILICIVVLLLCSLFSCQNKSNVKSGAYFLENATQKEKMERLLSVTIYDNGKIELATLGFSSSVLMPCKYSIENGELLVRLENGGDVIATFTVVNENTLVFKEASISLYADVRARYKYTPQWISFDENKITIYADNIPGIDVFQVINGESNRWSVADKNEIVSFAQWVENLILEKAVFDDGYSPGDNESDYGYIFRTSFGGRLFEYDQYSGGESYVYFGGDWYRVTNPSLPPLSES
jgi:hypothetical protein